MSNLVIVESPTKAKTLSRFLGSGFQVEATMGHVRDLPEKKFGIDIEKNFTPEYVAIAKKKDRLAEIKKLATGADQIYLATDPDREGEAIAWHVSELLAKSSEIKNPSVAKALEGKQNSKLKTADGVSSRFLRIAFHEITEPAIREALTHPRPIDLQLVDAQQARRVLDRLVGYKLSPLLWKKVRRGLSAGRVQSVAVRLVVEKERGIEAFKSKEYWEISVFLRKDKGAENESFWAKLAEVNGVKAAVKTKDEADPLVAGLTSAEYQVAALDTREAQRTPPPPFTTSTLQQTAANRFGWSAKKTMQLAQGLYEEGLITYHRTDSTNLSDFAIKMVRDYIKTNFNSDYLPVAPRLYKTKSKVAQEAHEAIRPTDVTQISSLPTSSRRPSGLRGASKSQNQPADSPQLGEAGRRGLGRDEERLYELIWKRFIACQMNPAKIEETTVKVSAESKKQKYLLEAKGSRVVFDGWLKLYLKLDKPAQPAGGYDQLDQFENGSEGGKLPTLSVGELLKMLEVKPEQKFTQPPSRYTEATLIKKLEELGIGRPSTYAPILSTIQDRQYVERVDPKTGLPPGRALKPTTLGVAVNDFIVQHFSDIVDYKFTAHMEEDLDEIANGKKEWVPVIREFYDPFSQKLEGAHDTKRVKLELEETGEMCPECKVGKLVIRLGRFGKFISCSRFPECKFRAPYVPKIEGVKCPEDGGDVVLRRTKKGKVFYGCINWPKCKWASWTRPKAAVEPDSTRQNPPSS